MIFTKYYLHADVSRSDVVGFIIVFLAFLLNEFHGMSYLLGRKEETNDAGKVKDIKKEEKELTTSNKPIIEKEPSKPN